MDIIISKISKKEIEAFENLLFKHTKTLEGKDYEDWQLLVQLWDKMCKASVVQKEIIGIW